MNTHGAFKKVFLMIKFSKRIFFQPSCERELRIHVGRARSTVHGCQGLQPHDGGQALPAQRLRNRPPAGNTISRRRQQRVSYVITN